MRDGRLVFERIGFEAKIMDQAGQALLNLHVWNPTEQFSRTRRIAVEAGYVERSWRRLRDGCPGPGEIRRQRRELPERKLLAREQVNRRWLRLPVRQQVDERNDAARRIVDVREVERVIRAFYTKDAPQHGAPGERRDDPVRVVARAPVDVGEPDDCGSQSFLPGRLHEPFALDLRTSVDVDGRSGASSVTGRRSGCP